MKHLRVQVWSSLSACGNYTTVSTYFGSESFQKRVVAVAVARNDLLVLWKIESKNPHYSHEVGSRLTSFASGTKFCAPSAKEKSVKKVLSDQSLQLLYRNGWKPTKRCIALLVYLPQVQQCCILLATWSSPYGNSFENAKTWAEFSCNFAE